MKQTWPAPERNKGPILEMLIRWVPEGATILEVAGGTGQHGAHFTRARPDWRWIPTEHDPAQVASMEAWSQDEGLPNLSPPQRLDVLERPWVAPPAQVVFCANMIHIAPWECAEALFEGAGSLLEPGGLLILYGPFRLDGEHTAPSNASFDASLRARDPRWGVRDLKAVNALAAEHGFSLVERVVMPANNQSVIWRRRSEPVSP